MNFRLFLHKFALSNFIYKIYEKRLWSQIKDGDKPNHIGIIMDGNRRFARKLGLPPTMGHQIGVEKLKEILRWCWDLDIKYLTLYSFSTENFERSPQEVKELMDLFYKNFIQITKDPEFHEKKIKFTAIGRIDLLPQEVQDAIHEAEESTAQYSDRVLQIAISYGGRAEIIDAIKNIIKDYDLKEIHPDDINEDTVANYLYTKDTPDPDLIIRTSGEMRLSGFMMWQSCYSELIFLDVYFPMMRKIDLWRTIRTYQQRERRFGR